jgi:pimeloyl-ACP methyl ester carboxylesterase
MRREHETERRSKAMNRWTLSREYRSSQGVVRYEAFGTGPPVVLVIPRCAHLAQEDAPDAVAELLTGFFAS